MYAASYDLGGIKMRLSRAMVAVVYSKLTKISAAKGHSAPAS
jgi:hypothetical protein